MSTPLRSIRFATSLPLPVMVSTFNVAILRLTFLAFFFSSFLSFFLLYCFPPLLCIQVACSPVALGAQSLLTIVVIPGLDRSGIKSDTTRIKNIWLGFTPDVLPVATPTYIRAWDRHQGCSDLNNLRGWVFITTNAFENLMLKERCLTFNFFESNLHFPCPLKFSVFEHKPCVCNQLICMLRAFNQFPRSQKFLLCSS